MKACQTLSTPHTQCCHWGTSLTPVLYCNATAHILSTSLEAPSSKPTVRSIFGTYILLLIWLSMPVMTWNKVHCWLFSAKPSKISCIWHYYKDQGGEGVPQLLTCNWEHQNHSPLPVNYTVLVQRYGFHIFFLLRKNFCSNNFLSYWFMYLI